MNDPNIFRPALANVHPQFADREAVGPHALDRLQEFGREIIAFAWPKGAASNHRPTHGDSVSRQKPVYPSKEAGQKAKELADKLKKKK